MRPYPSSAELATLRPPTPAQIATVTDGLEYKWSSNALAIQDRLTQAVECGHAADAQKWAIAGGISTEKVLLLKGRPTELIAHVHAHRHELGSVIEKMARALRPAHVTTSVTSMTQLSGESITHGGESVTHNGESVPHPDPLPTKVVA